MDGRIHLNAVVRIKSSILNSTFNSSAAKILRKENICILLTSLYRDVSKPALALHAVKILGLQTVSLFSFACWLDVDAGGELPSDGLAAKEEEGPGIVNIVN